jgi:aminotransferase
MNQKLLEIEPSLIRAIASKRRPTTIDLGLGEPTLLPQQRFIDMAAASVASVGLKYTLNAGDTELRERIAAHYGYPERGSADCVCITAGSEEAMYLAIKTLLQPGRDTLLIVEPAYPAYAKIAQLEGVAVERVGMPASTDFRYDVDAIVAAIGPTTRLIVIGSPANPTGCVLRDAEARRLADALRDRDVWVLYDELYRELTYVDKPGWLARYLPRTIAVNGLSKSNALTGLRIGWLIAEPQVVALATQAHALIATAASTFGQRVALEIFREPGALDEQAPWYRGRRAAVLAALEGSGLRYVVPDGAFYVCVKLADGADSLATALRLVEEFDVATVPGMTFGDTLEGWLRLSWVAPLEAFHEGLTRIAHVAAG